MKIQISNRVQHIANPSNYAPLFGTVIHIKDKRAQVAWEGKNQNKTWIKFESLKVIDNGWRDTPGMKSCTSTRTVTLPDGTVYREYRK
jgi:hypothetical protein